MDFQTNRTKIILVVIVIILIGVFILITKEGLSPETETVTQPVVVTPDNTNNTPQQSIKEEITVIAERLNIPWDLAFLPGSALLVTERGGNLIRIAGKDILTVKLPRPIPKGEGGLLGIVLHPNFAANKFVYLYMTTENSNAGTQNAVFRYTYENDSLNNEKSIVSGIPGAIYHDGGRMEFGPDGLLYITTGDATNEKNAQDKNSLSGKILRVKDDGSIPADNPFGTAVYSLGHRNPQGLAWDRSGRLWSTEHGRSGVTSGMDEINQIVKGKNYGWPTIEGDEEKTGMEVPAWNSGANDTWAPASLVYLDGSLYFGGLRGEAIYKAVLHNEHVIDVKAYFKNTYGRIRTIRLGPDGMFYITTSNRDGRGTASAADDRIIRIDPRTMSDQVVR